MKKVKQIVKQNVNTGKSWRERMGVEPTRDATTPLNGFEVRKAHRNLSAPPLC